jgi:hypothetical protein
MRRPGAGGPGGTGGTGGPGGTGVCLTAVRKRPAAAVAPKIKMTRSNCARASRMARPAIPDPATRREANDIIQSLQTKLLDRGLDQTPNDADIHYTPPVIAAGKGPAIKALGEFDAKVQHMTNHMATIKTRNVESSCSEPSWLLGRITKVPPAHGKLAEQAIKANAVNSSIIDRRRTQGAAAQTSRIDTESLTQAAMAQIVAVQTTFAVAKAIARMHGTKIANPMCTNAVDAPSLYRAAPSTDFFPITITSRLLPNANQTKIGAESVSKIIRKIASDELTASAINERMSVQSDVLHSLCRSIVEPGEYPLDAVWCALILIVYLSAHPEGRNLLRTTNLTDVDYQTAATFESYGRTEIIRRARLDNQTKKPEETDDLLPDVFDSEPKESMIPAKRKRGVKGGASSHTSDSVGILRWWHSALMCKNASVLVSLMAYNKQAAKNAADATLQRQACESAKVAQNPWIRELSEKNAVDSAKVLVTSFIDRKSLDMQQLVKWKWFDQDYIGIFRTINEASTTTIHASSFAPTNVQPPPEICMKIAWSQSAAHLTPRQSGISIPGVVERLNLALKAREAGKMNEIRAKRLIEDAFVNSDQPKTVTQTGVCRTTISMRATMTMHASQFLIGSKLADEMRNLAATTATTAAATAAATSDIPELTSIGKETPRDEPLCTPASTLALGLAINEVMRSWRVGKTRKNDPCRVLLDLSSTERIKASPLVSNTEPPPLLTIVDVGIELDHTVDIEAILQSNKDTVTVDADVALHVSGDGATRLPEVLHLLDQKIDNTVNKIRAINALLWAGASQSSFISNVGPVISATHTNTAISSSKKITLPDMHRVLFLTVYECFVAGLTNMDPSLLNSPYVGTYGATFDSGITSPGIQANNYRSDRRQHGNLALSQPIANKLCLEFAKQRYVIHPDRAVFTQTPIQTHGIPHSLIPGVHSAFDDYVEALETLRTHVERTELRTVDSIHVLPFSVWSQALNPVAEYGADPTVRTSVRAVPSNTGRASLPDATCEEAAIAVEPLFRRPHQVTTNDNPFATAYENVDTFFNCAAHFALLCTTCSLSLDAVHASLTAWICGDTGHVDMHPTLISTLLLLLNLMYPVTWGIAENMLESGLSCALPMLAKMVRTRERGGEACAAGLLCKLISEDKLNCTRVWWSAFSRADTTKCAWHVGVKPLLEAIQAQNGSYVRAPGATTRMRGALEAAARAAWLVHSPDGVSPPPPPCPASSALHMSCVSRQHVEPQFVNAHGVSQGALIGVKPYQHRQACSMALGLHLCDEIKIYRNEGGLSLRMSSAADILTENGGNRSSKSISPIQSEGDRPLFGSREQKLVMAKQQRVAWDLNTEQLAPIFSSVSPPLPYERRARGLRVAETASVRGRVLDPDEVFARAVFERAACHSPQ